MDQGGTRRRERTYKLHYNKGRCLENDMGWENLDPFTVGTVTTKTRTPIAESSEIRL